jgi:hypothetical protein
MTLTFCNRQYADCPDVLTWLRLPVAKLGNLIIVLQDGGGMRADEQDSTAVEYSGRGEHPEYMFVFSMVDDR